VIVFGLCRNTKKVLKTSKDAPHLCDLSTFFKKTVLFWPTLFCEYGHVIIFGLCCNGKKVLIFLKSRSTVFFGDFENFWKNIVKIYKKTHKRHIVSKFIDNFINDLVIND
jgi:hypothetical protein